MIRVLLADDHSIVRAGLRRLVEDSHDMEVVAEGVESEEDAAWLQELGCQQAQQFLPVGEHLVPCDELTARCQQLIAIESPVAKKCETSRSG